MHTIVGNDFEVIDADTTGLEAYNFQTISTVYYDRTTSASQTQLTVSVEFSDLYVGETYTLSWELCGGQQYYSTCNLYDNMNIDGQTGDPTESEGEFSFTTTTSTHTESFTFTDPGLLTYTPDPTGQTEGTYDGINNGTYNFQGILNIQGVPLDTNQSDYIVLGGEVITQSSYCLLYTSPSPRDGLLSRMPSSA